MKRNEFTPEDWKNVTIKVIHKKGDVENMSNYRPICSLLALYKLFSTILHGRFSPVLDQKQAEDQAGFRKSYQTTDHLATYRFIEQKCHEWGIKMWTATVDFTKAFDVKASVFCKVSARSRHFVNVDVIFLPSVCDSFCVSTFSLGQGCRSFCHEFYEQSTVVFCRSGRNACFTIVCILCADHVFWYPWFFWQEFNSFVTLFGLHANIVEEYVLLSALLHDQSCLQSSPCFQHQFTWLPFSRTLVCKGGCSFHVHGKHESRVFELVLRCCVTRS